MGPPLTSASLLASDESIADIALECGITDRSAFSRRFKRVTGTTLRDCRASLRARS